MPKIKIEATLKTPQDKIKYNVKAIIKDNTLIYHEEDKLNTLVTYDYQENVLQRDNKELHMKYIFKENIVTKGLLEIKDLNKYIEVLVKTKSIKKEGFNLEIKFTVENKEFIYNLKGELL